MGKNKKKKGKPKQRSSGRDTGRAALASIFSAGLFNSFEELATIHNTNVNVPTAGTPVMYRTLAHIHAGLNQLGATNSVQKLYLEPIMELYYSKSAIDRIDTVSQQSLYDQILIAFEMLCDLYFHFVPGALAPNLPKEAVGTGASTTEPFSLIDQQALMSILEKVWKIPLISINLFAFFKPIIQLSGSSFVNRTRPSYFIPFRSSLTRLTQGAATWDTSIEGCLSHYMALYESSIFKNQAVVPYVPFNRRMVEDIVIFAHNCKWSDTILQFIPGCSNSNKYFILTNPATQDIFYSMNYGQASELWALAPLYRQYSDTGETGVIVMPFADSGKFGVDWCNLNSSEGAWTKITTASTVLPAVNYNLYNTNLISGGAQGVAGYRCAMRYRKIAAPLSTATQWNLRFLAFAAKFDIFRAPVAVTYAGDKTLSDIAFGGGAGGDGHNFNFDFTGFNAGILGGGSGAPYFIYSQPSYNVNHPDQGTVTSQTPL